MFTPLKKQNKITHSAPQYLQRPVLAWSSPDWRIHWSQSLLSTAQVEHQGGELPDQQRTDPHLALRPVHHYIPQLCIIKLNQGLKHEKIKKYKLHYGAVFLITNVFDMPSFKDSVRFLDRLDRRLSSSRILSSNPMSSIVSDWLVGPPENHSGSSSA